MIAREYLADVMTAWGEAAADFRFAWRQLVAIDLLYKALAAAVLVPTVGAALSGLLRLSGTPVRADQDILLFLISPLGLFTGLLVAGAVITVSVLELACLMIVGVAAHERRRVTVVSALRFSLGRLLVTLKAAVRLVARLFFIVAPFLAVSGAIAWWLFSQHDVNYYLTHRPPVFLASAAVVVCLLGVMLALLVKRLLGWIYVLPLLLFESADDRQVFASSEARAASHRRTLGLTLASWVVATVLTSACLLGFVRLLGLGLSGFLHGRVAILMAALAGLLLLWVTASLLVHLLSSCFLALLMTHAYGAWGGQPGSAVPAALVEPEGGRHGWVAQRSVWVLFAAVAVLATAMGISLVDEIRTDQEVRVIAHRGAAGSAPENTLAAVEEALVQGADWVEVDVQETADGVVAVIHDSDLMKVAGVATKIWEAPYEELAGVDIGSWFHEKFSEQRLPTLADVLDLVRDRAGLNIELKYYGHDERLAERVVEIVESLDMESQVEVMSLKSDAALEMRVLRPDWSVGLLTARALGDLTGFDTDFLAVNSAIASRDFIRRAHAAGKRVYVWTVNDLAGMSRTVSRGADGLITDYPGMAREFLDRRAQMSSVERLFLDLALRIGIAASPVDARAETGG